MKRDVMKVYREECAKLTGSKEKEISYLYIGGEKIKMLSRKEYAHMKRDAKKVYREKCANIPKSTGMPYTSFAYIEDGIVKWITREEVVHFPYAIGARIVKDKIAADIYFQKEIYQRTVNHPAPRFYVNAKSALRYISPMMRGDRREIDKMKPLRREMYEVLFDVVLRLSQKERFWGESIYSILRQAVMEPAPRFYIDVTRMGQIFRSQQEKDKARRMEMENKYRRN